jgi:hypothetical protein
MADMDELFDRYAVVKPEFDRLKKEMEVLKRELKPYFNARSEVLSSNSGVQIRMDGRCQMNDAKLLERIGARVFREISKRVSVAALVKAAVLKGKIKQEDVDASMEPTENWFKIL